MEPPYNDDEYERRAAEYYDRKVRKADEMLPYLIIMWAIFLALVAGWAVFGGVMWLARAMGYGE